jgi:hypothetical protein
VAASPTATATKTTLWLDSTAVIAPKRIPRSSRAVGSACREMSSSAEKSNAVVAVEKPYAPSAAPAAVPSRQAGSQKASCRARLPLRCSSLGWALRIRLAPSPRSPTAAPTSITVVAYP